MHLLKANLGKLLAGSYLQLPQIIVEPPTPSTRLETIDKRHFMTVTNGKMLTYCQIRTATANHSSIHPSIHPSRKTKKTNKLKKTTWGNVTLWKRSNSCGGLMYMTRFNKAVMVHWTGSLRIYWSPVLLQFWFQLRDVSERFHLSATRATLRTRLCLCLPYSLHFFFDVHFSAEKKRKKIYFVLFTEFNIFSYRTQNP